MGEITEVKHVAPRSVGEWRRARRATEEWVTPSGLRVALRRVSLLNLVEQGAIPTPLLGMVDQVTSGKTTIDVRELADFLPLVNAVVRAVVVTPRIEDGEIDPDDDTRISIGELTFADKLALFEWAMGGDQEGAARLTRFFQDGA